MEHSTSRLEAFSDAVIAIIITIMVLELRVPEGGSLGSLVPLIPTFIAYLWSFQTLGTYWNNHHHLIRATKEVSAGIMIANLNLLFWLSLIPFATAWLGQNYEAVWPTVFYAILLLICAIAYQILSRTIIVHQGTDSVLAAAVGSDTKGKISLGLYIAGVISAFFYPWLGDLFVVAVAVIWFLPDRRIEKGLGKIS